MKMVKSLLLGSAAGLVAVGGAQAADLPVKAKPVEYVKICSLYGAGYYYIPGTDICLRVGGFVRQEWTYNFGQSMSTGPWANASGHNTRVDGTADTVWRTRAYVNTESRQQTAYGTLRTYFNIGVSGNNSVDLNANRAFIQIAGFTVGRATSYFDHYSAAAIAYLVDTTSDTGDGGQEVFAYTAQLGNGVSASISIENPANRRQGVYNGGAITINPATGLPIVGPLGLPVLAVGGSALALAFNPASAYAKLIAPDIVGNIRVDQAWGSFQVMAAAHEVSGGYYDGNNLNNGHPGETWGWAVGAGLKVNLPMLGPGDYFAIQGAYTVGASDYAGQAPFSTSSASFSGGGGPVVNPLLVGGNSVGYGWDTDAVYAAGARLTGGGPIMVGGTDLELTTNWNVAAGWEHFWTPSLRTSLHGSYNKITYNSTANNILCLNMNGGAGELNFNAAVGATPALTVFSSCNNDWAYWQVGSRTQWNVTSQFYMGFDIVYRKLETASAGAIVNYTQGATAQPTGFRVIEDQDVWSGRWRWHRDLP